MDNAGVVVITGASGNLGQRVARLLAARGVPIALWDRDAARARALGLEARCAEVDVGDPKSVASAVSELRAQASIAGLVCTVGGYAGGKPFLDAEPAELTRMLTVNLHTFAVCAREVGVALRQRGAGSIVCVSSAAANGAAAGQAAYGAAKAAVSSLSRSLAAELKDAGVRVNAVLPGTLDTPENRAWMDEETAARAVPLEDVAEVIAFLLSDASRSVTGAEIPVRGRQ